MATIPQEMAIHYCVAYGDSGEKSSLEHNRGNTQRIPKGVEVFPLQKNLLQDDTDHGGERGKYSSSSELIIKSNLYKDKAIGNENSRLKDSPIFLALQTPIRLLHIIS